MNTIIAFLGPIGGPEMFLIFMVLLLFLEPRSFHNWPEELVRVSVNSEKPAKSLKMKSEREVKSLITRSKNRMTIKSRRLLALSQGLNHETT
jgi:hypothetical protein